MPNYFLQMLQHLRHYEEIMLYGNLLHVSKEDGLAAAAYLEAEYKTEALDFPFKAPRFDADAALWAAKILYIATQLLFYREHKEADLESLLPTYNKDIDAAAMLSADLTLRFLPLVITQLKRIDPEDGLIELLTAQLVTWHYSGIAFPLPGAQLCFDVVDSNKCLQQLYVNRVIEYKRLALADHPALTASVRASLGLFSNHFWTDLKHDPITKS
jgi:hypothetical protein